MFYYLWHKDILLRNTVEIWSLKANNIYKKTWRKKCIYKCMFYKICFKLPAWAVMTCSCWDPELRRWRQSRLLLRLITTSWIARAFSALRSDGTIHNCPPYLLWQPVQVWVLKTVKTGVYIWKTQKKGSNHFMNDIVKELTLQTHLFKTCTVKIYTIIHISPITDIFILQLFCEIYSLKCVYPFYYRHTAQVTPGQQPTCTQWAVLRRRWLTVR